MITIEKKDFVVTYLLVDDYSDFILSVDDDFAEQDITYDECLMILRQLEKMGMIEIVNQFLNSNDVQVSINASLHDFHSRGGFKAQELILLTKLEKLDAELQFLRLQLEPDRLEQLDKVVSIFTSVCTMLPYVKATMT